jgi:hypothetical protein
LRIVRRKRLLRSFNGPLGVVTALHDVNDIDAA